MHHLPTLDAQDQEVAAKLFYSPSLLQAVSFALLLLRVPKFRQSTGCSVNYSKISLLQKGNAVGGKRRKGEQTCHHSPELDR
jgi:hypothetical protein